MTTATTRYSDDAEINAAKIRYYAAVNAAEEIAAKTHGAEYMQNFQLPACYSIGENDPAHVINHTASEIEYMNEKSQSRAQ